MINNKENPVQWPLLICELDDAREHFEELIDQMNVNGEIDEVEFSIRLTYIAILIGLGTLETGRLTKPRKNF